MESKKITIKNRVLYLLDLLLNETDDEHYLSTNDIISYFDENGIVIDRKTVKALIEILVDYGIDIMEIKSSPNKYYVHKRAISEIEIKLLVNAVESSKFISKNKSDEIVKKLFNLLSRHKREQIRGNLYVANRVKTWNEDLYEKVDLINQAINSEMQMSFKYYDYTEYKEKVLCNKGELYQVSPYALLWNDDRYYVIGYSNKYEKIVRFRVDRMYKPKIVLIKSVKKPEDFDIVEYSRQVADMFSGTLEKVTLQCNNSLMKLMIDRFGEDIETIVVDENSFSFSTSISVSPIFYGWIFQFENKVKILAPKNVLEQYKFMVISASNDN